MRIPLDYYRILGLPIQATAEQLQQAHRDRTLQLPRREFSEAAIVARRDLIDEAYAILSDPIQRQDYDTNFLAKSYDLLEAADTGVEEEPGWTTSTTTFDPDSDAYTAQIEIAESQLAGALLILQEMGEYELVMKYGRPHITSTSLKNSQFGDSDLMTTDIVLTVALACLELGREQWQQGQSENAAMSLETGQELLLRAGLFANIRGEMQADLYKLRPYRVLELLALPESQRPERSKGLALLQDMLQERNGIDGSGNDQSGLNVDDFLRFIQQLREYLTAAEQQALFEMEARRPSAVAMYLSVYALIARGFAQRQPGLIRRAKQMLVRLGTRQDVHLEQAICALLLGQTEEASRALELSQEFDSLQFIREHSQGSPDLLPGLCLYSERWLQTEVFPHFRDLNRKKASLKEYFADEDVQIYLEELPNESETSGAAVSSSTYYSTSSQPRLQVMPSTTGRGTYGSNANGSGHLTHSANGTSATATISPPSYPETHPIATSPPAAERISGDNHNGNQAALSPTGHLPTRPQDRLVEAPPPRRPRRSGFRIDRLFLLVGLGLLGVLLLSFLLRWAFGRSASDSAPAASSTALRVRPMGPSLLKLEGLLQPTSSETLTPEGAQQIVQTWLSAKIAAMGETHAIDELAKILVDPALSQWQGIAERERAGSTHVKYEHSGLTVTNVETRPDNPNEAIVEAIVSEKSQPFANGQPDGSPTSSEALQMRYTLTRQDGQWRIQNMGQAQ